MLVLAIVWQLNRLHALQLIGSKTEQDLLNWVSEIEPVTAFNDAKFADGILTIKLETQINASVVDYNLVRTGGSEEDKEMNAKYAISIARKLGAVIFLDWHDILERNKKMILLFVCALYELKYNQN